ncbi:hypothetical protein MRX96_037016 [Rhipicephalus microplus]
MDSKRSWVVAGACFWTNVFAYPLLGAAGVVYVNILNTFHVTREEASWPVSLTSTFYLLAGLLGGILNKYISIQTILVVSCTLSALLVSACYFTTGLWFLILVLGVLHGIFVGGIRLNVVAINKHFVKHLASASGLNMAGLSVGGFVLPPLLPASVRPVRLQRGALLICGGISLNAVPAAMLCGDPDKPKSSALCTAEHKQANEEDCLGEGKVPEEQVIITDSSSTVYYQCDKVEVLPDKPLKEVSGYELLSPVLPEKSPCKYVSNLKDFPTRNSEKKTPLMVIASTGRRTLGPNRAAVTEHNYGFILNPHFYLVTFTHLIVFTNMVTCLTVIIDFAVDCGIPKWNSCAPGASVLYCRRCGAPWLGLGDGQRIPVQERLDRVVLVLLGCGVGVDAASAFLWFVVCQGRALVGLANLLRPLLIGHFRHH